MAFAKMEKTVLPPRQWALVGYPGAGKAQPLDSLVKVPGGWKRMGDISLYDSVCSQDGKPSLVVGLYPQGVQPVYRITFNDGRSTRVTGDHLWRVLCKSWPTPRVITTNNIIRLINGKSYGNRLYVPLIAGDSGKDAKLPIDPYILGVLLGDGSLSSGGAQFTKPDSELAANVSERAALWGRLVLDAASGRGTWVIPYAAVIAPQRSSTPSGAA